MKSIAFALMTAKRPDSSRARAKSGKPSGTSDVEFITIIIEINGFSSVIYIGSPTSYKSRRPPASSADLMACHHR